MATQFRDGEMDMVRYMHPNRGDHPVYGVVTRKFYGNRRGAGVETFLVHRSDIAAQPHYFVVVSAETAPPAPAVKPPPPPQPLSGPVEMTPPVVVEEKEVLAGETPPPEVARRVLNDAKFDLQTLPGVTPAIARAMAGASLVSAERILETGTDGLLKVKGIGQMKAEMILAYIKDNFEHEPA